MLLSIGIAECQQEQAICPNGGFDYIRNVVLVDLWIKVLLLLFRKFLVGLEVKVGTGVDAFHLFESKGEFEFDVHGRIGIVGQLFVWVLAEFVSRCAQSQVPSHSGGRPLFVPFQFGARAHKKLHFHLLKLPHTEDKLPCYDLVTEGFADLGDAKRNLHAGGLLHVEEVDKDPLCRLRTKVDGGGVLCYGAYLG